MTTATYDGTTYSPLTRAILRTSFDKAREESSAAMGVRDAFARVIAAWVCGGHTVTPEDIDQYRALEQEADEASDRSTVATEALSDELRKARVS